VHQLTEDIKCDNDDWDVDERKESDAQRRIWKVLLGLKDDGRVKTERHCVQTGERERGTKGCGSYVN
jgi:hypothetical protein